MQSLMKSSTPALRLMYVRSATMATGTTKKSADKASGDEKNYINKQEQQLLKNLLKKVKDQAAKVELPEEKKLEQAQTELKELCSAHNVKASDSLLKDLHAWKSASI